MRSGHLQNVAHAVHYQGEIDGLQTEMSDGIEGSQFTLDEDLVAGRGPVVLASDGGADVDARMDDTAMAAGEGLNNL